MHHTWVIPGKIVAAGNRRDFVFGSVTRIDGIRTDLALEARELHSGIAGVTESTERFSKGTVTRISVCDEQAARRLDKPVGDYVTVEAPGIALRDPDSLRAAAEAAAGELARLLHFLEPSDTVLVAGLGNRYVTPDSLGPRTVERVLVTRHIARNAPELAPKGMRPVAAVSPGVLGVTGVESAEAVRGFVERVRPAALICIDALLSRNAARISAVIQINNSGLLPGAGVGNRQKGVDEATLGLPVIAIGVPTVVSAHTIVWETVSSMGGADGENGPRLSRSIAELMERRYGQLFVTPKDVDVMIEDAANVLAGAINRALHGERLTQIETLLS